MLRVASRWSVQRAAVAAACSASRREQATTPAKDDRKFHCSVCFKAFRLEMAAQLHLKQAHNNDGTIEPGPGPGIAAAPPGARPAGVGGAPMRGGPGMPMMGGVAAPGGAADEEEYRPLRRQRPTPQPLNKSILELPAGHMETMLEVWDKIGAQRIPNFLPSTAVAKVYAARPVTEADAAPTYSSIMSPAGPNPFELAEEEEQITSSEDAEPEATVATAGDPSSIADGAAAAAAESGPSSAVSDMALARAGWTSFAIASATYASPFRPQATLSPFLTAAKQALPGPKAAAVPGAAAGGGEEEDPTAAGGSADPLAEMEAAVAAAHAAASPAVVGVPGASPFAAAVAPTSPGQAPSPFAAAAAQSPFAAAAAAPSPFGAAPSPFGAAPSPFASAAAAPSPFASAAAAPSPFAAAGQAPSPFGAAASPFAASGAPAASPFGAAQAVPGPGGPDMSMVFGGTSPSPLAAEPKLACPKCDRVFSTQRALSDHAAAKHDLELPRGGKHGKRAAAPMELPPYVPSPVDLAQTAPYGTVAATKTSSWSEVELFPSATTATNMEILGVVKSVEQGELPSTGGADAAAARISTAQLVVNVECEGEQDDVVVRVFGPLIDVVMATVTPGSTIAATGILRLNPQLDATANKYFFAPALHVHPATGFIARVA